jgi:hypothetical protein
MSDLLKARSPGDGVLAPAGRDQGLPEVEPLPEDGDTEIPF